MTTQQTIDDTMARCVGYLDQIYDGQLSRDDAYDAIHDKIAHLDDDAACEISRLCFEYDQQRMAQ